MIKAGVLLMIWQAAICAVLYGGYISAQPNLLINEIVANNVTILADDSVEFDDFVEIYNAGRSAVDIAGMYLSNSLEDEKKWQIPQPKFQVTVLHPKRYILIWCDKDEWQGTFHAGINLNARGESLYLIDKDGTTIIDSVSFPKQYPDISFGRINQGNEWSYLSAPTPGQPNEGQKRITTISSRPVIVQKGGFFTEDVIVEIEVPEGCEVYVTTDSKIPRQEVSKKYENSFTINETSVVSARAFREGFLPSEIVAETYFFNENISLSVVSISMDPRYLYDPQSGVYSNPFRNFEKPVNFEYFDREGRSVVNLSLALKIFGYTSRISAKQSFSVKAKKKFGAKRIEYAFFDDKPHIKSVDGLILRADATSGRGGGDRETAGERVKTELIYKINRVAGSNVDIQAYQPVVLFLNGKYWGLYNLMEQKGKDFIKNNYGINKIDMLNRDDLEVVAGDTIHYQKMLDYAYDNDVYEDTTVQNIFSMIDRNSLVDYWISEIYSATHDYHVNIRMWRPRTKDGKWRMLAYDEDSWGKYDEVTFYNLTAEYYPETIFFWNEMLESTYFRNFFINRVADLLNTVFLPQKIQRMIDDIQGVIKDEKQRDYDRWKNLVHFVEPGSQIAFLKDFAEKRPDFLRSDMLDRFELPGISSIVLEVKGKGKIQINSIKPESFPWEGIYFMTVPVSLTAIPEDGHSFKGWGELESKQKTITYTPSKENHIITAIFE